MFTYISSTELIATLRYWNHSVFYLKYENDSVSCMKLIQTMEQLVFTICFSIASLHQVILACMVTDPTESTTKPPITASPTMCCKAPKFEDGSGRGVFLMTMGGKCPKMDTFLCRGPGDNTYNELGKYIVINGEINVKEDKQGGPIEIDITCNTADGTWRVDFQGESLVVKTVRCDNR